MLGSRDIFFAFLLVGSTVSLEVQITPSYGEISVGESKFFQCEVVGIAKHIEWFGPSGNRIDSNSPDVTVNRNDGSTSTLTLYKAGTDNAGTYKCVASNGDKQAESTVNVKIYQKITFTNAPSPQEFNEGDNAIIVCDVTSSPPPTVIWTHKGTRIQVEKDVRFKVLSNKHLQIRGIKKTDEGSFTCEGRLMSRGEIDLRVIKVIVNVLPTIRVWQLEINATADVRQSAMLTCAVDGYPEPLVTWRRNHLILEPGEKYSFNEDGSEITIMDVTKLDEGEYNCIAKNKAGESEQELSLRVFVKPKITYLVNQSTSETEEQVTLTCEASGDPTPTISWSYGVHVFTEGEQASWTRPEQHKSPDGNVVVRSDARVSSLTLKYVKYTDAGLYLCTAQSAMGEDARTAYLEVRYAPKIQGTVAVYTWEGNAVNISCEVHAHPTEVSLLWLRDRMELPNANTTNIKIFKSPLASYVEVTPDSEDDFGSYNCTASNEMGSESKEFLLIQAEVPSAPSIGKVEPFSSSARVHFQEPESTGGVPFLSYRAEWRKRGQGSWEQRVYAVQEGVLSELTVTGLKPETDYEVKMSAINGKGEGDCSSPVFFKTEPVHGKFHFFTKETGKPSAPKLEGAPQPKGNSLRIHWIKQDDGGSPILHYLVHYKPKQLSEWKPEIRLPSNSEYVTLNGLEWDTDYDIYVVAENQKGRSQPGTLSFRTSPEPAAIPDLSEETLEISMGVIVGIIVVIFVLLLLAVDIICYFVNKCGLIMCLCGKSGSGTKGHNMEEGTAAFINCESKEQIVEVRTEDECTANHNAGGPTEPSETTPLTEPELAAHTAALARDPHTSVATNSDTATATFDPAQDSPSSDTTTLTYSLSALANDPSPTPAPAPAPTPESNTALPNPLFSTADVTAKMAPLVQQRGYDAKMAPIVEQRGYDAKIAPVVEQRGYDAKIAPEVEQRGYDALKADEKITTPPHTPEQTNVSKSTTPVPPKRRNSPKLAALAAKGSPPVSALARSSASASPDRDTKNGAPRPPGSHLPGQPAPVAPDTETPGQTAPVSGNTATAKADPALSISPRDASLSPLNNDESTDQAADHSADSATDGPKPALNATAVAGFPVVVDSASKAEECAPADADILTPVPPTTGLPTAAASFCASGLEAPVFSALVSTPQDVCTYDLLSDGPPPPYATGPAAPQLELSLTNGIEPPADLISLDSPPSAPTLSSGEGAGLPASGPALEASETLAKAAPPVNDENIILDEKRKAEEAELTNALTMITADDNNLIQTNIPGSKA